ncbi:hypothetical protein Pmani_003158 [Petrolisthes manimaculis]|uniref:Uncharacterized protein n=1 Tax=Petrolisthes manimaculis TaxID=1843537 RepID=A0AAE1QGU4_9EUCA|nr:hypothetical protein Pmani_015378 [Petrolisthes manimaculis]KAK4326294.1 hypothetical protein Pmani_003158 [Petrolisthes manimaculis]
MDKRVAKSKCVTTERTKIIWLWLAGLAARDIATETGTSLSTVYRWIRRWEKEGTLATRSQYDRCTYQRPSWDYNGIVVNSLTNTAYQNNHFIYNVYAKMCSAEL